MTEDPWVGRVAELLRARFPQLTMADQWLAAGHIVTFLSKGGWLPPSVSVRLVAERQEQVASRETRITELEAEIERLRHGYATELMDTMEQFALAMGWPKDPEYSYGTGDHTTVTLAAEVRRRVEHLQAYIEQLERDL